MINSTGSQRGLLYEKANRRKKAAKIWKVLGSILSRPASELSLLDVGCSAGIISGYLADHFGQVIGIDLDSVGLSLARDQESLASFAHASSDAIPFIDDLFDVVLCAQVYEHVADQKSLASEIYRVLKPGGLVFFSGPNKFSLIEPHYGLPFLSWLPRSQASIYLRITRRGSYYEETPLSLPGLRHLWRSFSIEDLTVPMIKEPTQFNIEDEMGALKFTSFLPGWLIQSLVYFFPNYNWILRKPISDRKSS